MLAKFCSKLIPVLSFEDGFCSIHFLVGRTQRAPLRVIEVLHHASQWSKMPSFVCHVQWFVFHLLLYTHCRETLQELHISSEAPKPKAIIWCYCFFLPLVISWTIILWLSFIVYDENQIIFHPGSLDNFTSSHNNEKWIHNNNTSIKAKHHSRNVALV